MNERQSKLLAAIIDQFIDTAAPVGSRKLLEAGYFNCSSATIRSEMLLLEDEGFLQQPHVSAGRIPTAKGYRSYVQKHMQPSKHEKVVRKRFVAVPHKKQVYYLGLANALRQPEFLADPRLASGVAEVLEEHLYAVLDTVEVDGQIRYYIGDNHILPQIQSCSLMVTEYRVRDQRGAIGILGPMRMDYAYNTVALDMAADLLRSNT